MNEPHLTGAFPMPEMQPPVISAPVETDPVISRRVLLRTGAAAAAGFLLLSGCSGEDEPAIDNANSPANPSYSPQAPETPYATGPATPYATEGSYPTEGATPSESGATPTPSTTETATNRPKPEAVGHTMELKWSEQTNDKLAAEIRKKGLVITSDPSMAGLDESYFPTATVIGLPKKAAKGRKLGVAVVSTSPDGEGGDKVYKAPLPTGNVTKHGKTVAQLPAAVSSKSGEVHPYRFRRGAEELTVVFYTTDKKGKNAKVVDPVVLNPKINVNNGTYANANII